MGHILGETETYEIQLRVRGESMGSFTGWVTLHKAECPKSGMAHAAEVLRQADGLRAAARALNRVAQIRITVEARESAQ